VVARALVWAFALLFSLTTYTFSDDHFGRISPARQIARYGELPFRDFFDPGYFMTEVASASVQRLLGDNLLGEMLLTSLFVAGGALAIFLLVRRATGSLRLACVTTIVAVLAFRRPYDYDKFLFYPLGLLVSWRYGDSRRIRDLFVIASVAVVAAMFRYDNGLFVAAGAFAVIAAVHAGESARMGQRAGLFISACVLCVTPYVLFLQANVGLGEAVDQMTTYARREGSRTGIATLPRGALSDIHVTWLPPPQPDESWRRRLRRHVPLGTASVSWGAAGAAAVAYYLFVALSVAAAVTVLRRRNADRLERGRVLSAVSMTLLAVILVLREPVIARIGGMIGPPAVLGAWMWYRSARSPRATTSAKASASAPDATADKTAVKAARGWHLMRLAVAVCALGTMMVATEWRSSLSLVRRNGSLLTRLADATASPPSTTMLPKPRLRGLVDYLRRCTRPDDRIFAAWFVPELYFFAGRAFAGGMVETFGDHWSEPDHQRRIVEKMKAQSVPLVLMREGDESFARGYPIVAGYLGGNYRTAGSSAFGGTDGGRYTVLTRTDRTMTGIDAATSMPCFAQGT
jgi:hypothetical protein